MISEIGELARRNRLLNELGDDVLAELLSGASVVELRHKARIHERRTAVDHAYFPVDCVISWIGEMRDGKCAEVMTFGCEGMAGVAAAFDATQGAISSVVQHPGRAIRVDAQHFKAVLSEHRSAGIVMYRYASSLMNIMAQTSACSRLHDLSERCAKWLLSMHDRVPGDALPIDQQLLADMLGARRQSVSVTTSMLQDAGLIKRKRSRTIVVDRAGLERAACECYAIIACEGVPDGRVVETEDGVRSQARTWFRETYGKHGTHYRTDGTDGPSAS